MMSVKEYAQDINMDVKVVLNKAQELGYAQNEDDILDEDQVIDLDNVLVMNPEENDEETTYIEEITDEKDYDLDEELEDKAEELASASHLKFDDTVKKQKLKNKKQIISNR